MAPVPAPRARAFQSSSARSSSIASDASEDLLSSTSSLGRVEKDEMIDATYDRGVIPATPSTPSTQPVASTSATSTKNVYTTLLSQTATLLLQHDAAPMGVLDMELLADNYLTSLDTACTDPLFVKECAIGVVRHAEMLHETLNTFYDWFKVQRGRAWTGARRDHHLFSVLLYLALFRLEDVSMAQYSNFLTGMPAHRALPLVQFLIDCVPLPAETQAALIKEGKTRRKSEIPEDVFEGMVLASIDRLHHTAASDQASGQAQPENGEESMGEADEEFLLQLERDLQDKETTSKDDISAIATQGGGAETKVPLHASQGHSGLNQLVIAIWLQTFEETYVSDKLIRPIQNALEALYNLRDYLEDRVRSGLTTSKAAKKATEPAPFALTMPRARALPEPVPVPSVPKAKPAPKTTYAADDTSSQLMKQREKNKESALKAKEEADVKVFSILKRPQKKGSLPAPEVPRVAPRKVTPAPKFSAPSTAPKGTTSTILRETHLLAQRLTKAASKIKNAEVSLHDDAAFAQWQSDMKRKAELDAEKQKEARILEVMIGREEAIRVRDDVEQQNAEVAAAVKEQQIVMQQWLEEERALQNEANKKLIQTVHETIHESAKEAKREVVIENQKLVAQLAEEKAALVAAAKIEAEKERIKKQELIREIRLLEKKQQEDRDARQRGEKVDLTTTTNSGLFSEMSIVELRERLDYLKIEVAEEEKRKHAEITAQREYQMQQLRQKEEDLKRWRSIEQQQASTSKAEAEALRFEQERQAMRAADPLLTNLKTQLQALRQARAQALQEKQERRVQTVMSPAVYETTIGRKKKQAKQGEFTTSSQAMPAPVALEDSDEPLPLTGLLAPPDALLST